MSLQSQVKRRLLSSQRNRVQGVNSHQGQNKSLYADALKRVPTLIEINLFLL
jgi:hypothetical protein